jgi:hypothetical protein
MAELPVKPVEEYLINGPIPAEDLIYLDFLKIYIEYGIVDTELDICFMLEHVSTHGAPGWWKGTVSEFEQEFHQQYHQIVDKKWKEDVAWRTAYDEVNGGRLLPKSEDAPDEQVEKFLAHGIKRRDQVWAVELLLNMWVEAKESGAI